MFNVYVLKKLFFESWNYLVAHYPFHFVRDSGHGNQNLTISFKPGYRSCSGGILNNGAIFRHQSLIAGKFIHNSTTTREDCFYIFIDFLRKT